VDQAVNQAVRSDWKENTSYILEDDKKIFFIGSDRIGEEYELVKKLISSGISSSYAHKVIKKIKLKKD